MMGGGGVVAVLGGGEWERWSVGKDRGFAANATVIGLLTLVSRVLGMAREVVAAGAFGAGGGWSAFTWAFMIPNLFRKLLGEGALSAAFIPLYARAVRGEREGGEETKRQSDKETKGGDGGTSEGSSGGPLSAREFALASVNLLVAILIGLTVVGEVIIGGLYWFVLTRADHLLAAELTAVMLPYVLLVCGTAFMGGILQVHHRFAAVAATSIVLNLVLILAIGAGGKWYDFTTEAGQTRGVFLLSVAVLVAGLIQVGMLVPSLRAVGFQFRLVFHVLTPEVKKMMRMTLPVAIGAAVLQLSVVLDKGIAFFLAEGDGVKSFVVWGREVAYPMAEGAIVRLNLAQFMYQFPLGVFAIALATAIFPKLAGDAMDVDKTAFRGVLRKGLMAALFIGLPASVGMVVVAEPAVKLLFLRGAMTAEDVRWVIWSTVIYSSAIWAFSVQQILSRAYYALHDTRTPLVWAAVNLGINLVVELPLIFTPLREAGMAVGTLVSFAIQAVVMTWMLSKRVEGIGLRGEVRNLGVMVGAALGMGAACWGVMQVPGWPSGEGRGVWAVQLGVLMGVGAVSYAVLCRVGGIDVVGMVRRKR